MGVDKTAKHRTARYKERMRASGFVVMEIWTHPDDKEKIRAYAKRLRDKR